MNVLQSLAALSSYPIPTASLQNIAEEAGLDPDCEVVCSVRTGSDYKHAKALTYYFLSECPNVTQGGISYSFTDSEKARLRAKADALMSEIGKDTSADSADYGYKGGEV